MCKGPAAGYGIAYCRTQRAALCRECRDLLEEVGMTSLKRRELRSAAWKKSMGQTISDYCRRYHFANKGPYNQSYCFSSSRVWMWELDHKEGQAPKNWCFWTWCWRRLLRVPWTARRFNQSILEKISPEYSLEGLMLKLKLRYFWPPDPNWLIGKVPGAGKNWRQEEKGMTENGMV